MNEFDSLLSVDNAKLNDNESSRVSSRLRNNTAEKSSQEAIARDNEREIPRINSQKQLSSRLETGSYGLGRSIWDCIWIVIATIYTWKAFHYRGVAGSLPRLVGLLLLILAVVDLVVTGHSIKLSDASLRHKSSNERNVIWSRVLSIVGLSIAFVALWNIVGTLIDVVLFIIGTTVVMRTGSVLRILVNISVGIGFFVLFEVVVHFSGGYNLPWGILSGF